MRGKMPSFTKGCKFERFLQVRYASFTFLLSIGGKKATYQ